MPNLREEGLTTLVLAVSLAGRESYVNTLRLLRLEGLDGIQLEHFRIGRRICTSRKALERFYDNLADRDAFTPVAVCDTLPALDKARCPQRTE